MDKYRLERVAFLLTMRCNLKCRLCVAMAPYFGKVKDIPIEQLQLSIKNLFEFSDRVGHFSIGGGEPFLSNTLVEFLDFMLGYHDRIEKLDIVTNGTIVTSQELVSVLQKFSNMYVIVDDYGADLSRKFDKVCTQLENAGIMVERRSNNAKSAHCDGWFDMLDLLSPPEQLEKTKEKFYKCIYSKDLRCNVVYDGKMYPCSRAMAFHQLGEIPEEKSLYLDLLDVNKSATEWHNELLEHLNAEYFPACAYCKGGLRTSVRHVPAEQME